MLKVAGLSCFISFPSLRSELGVRFCGRNEVVEKKHQFQLRFEVLYSANTIRHLLCCAAEHLDE